MPKRSFAFLAALALSFGPGCDGSKGIAPKLSLFVVAGGAQTDTACARLAQALVIQVLDPDGQVAVGEIVRFEYVPGDSAHPAPLALAALTSAEYGLFVADPTDAGGQASVLVQLGEVAGTGRVAVSVPRFAYEDTVAFTILPGRAAGVVVGPPDTALYVGHGYPLRGYVTDVHGNRRGDPVTYQALDASTSVGANGQVTGVAVGRSTILVRAAASSVVDTANVSVVPAGTLGAVASYAAAYPATTIVTMQLDGSGGAVVPQSAGENNYLSWSSGGASLLFFRPGFGGHTYTITPSGTMTQLVQGAAFEEDNWARPAAGGSWVYFRATRSMYAGFGFIWRIHPDGTGPDSVPVGVGTQPSPSPDGARVAYAGGDEHLHVYDYGTHTDRDFGWTGWAPHWSPDGQWIAYMTDQWGPIWVVKPDGSGARALTSGGYYDWSFDWSPDSKWVVVLDQGRGILSLIQVQTGLTLPLPFSTGLLQPTLKP